MTFRDRSRFLKDTYKKHGWREMLRVGKAGVRHLGEARMVLFALSEPRPLPRAIEASRDHKFRFASPQDLERLSETPDYSIAPIDVERVSKGIARCLLQMDGDKLVGYAWIWTGRLAYIEDGVHVNLPDDTIYNYKGYTNPEYRGYGYQALRHLQLLKLTADEGVTRLFGFVDHFNSNSLKGVSKSGYVPVGELRVRHKNGRARMILDLQEDFWSTEART